MLGVCSTKGEAESLVAQAELIGESDRENSCSTPKPERMVGIARRERANAQPPDLTPMYEIEAQA